MKKARIIAVIAALIVSLSGCANTDYPQAIQDSSDIETVASETYEHTEPEDRSSASVSESKESTAESTTTVKAETESAQAENSQPAAEQSPAPGAQPPQAAVPNNTPKPETPKAVEPTPEPKPEPIQQPTPLPVEEQPTPEPVQTEPPQEITPEPEEPAPKSIYDYEFDVAAIRLELIAVGEAMGLTHNGDLTPDSASWSTPVTASSDFQGANLERRLKDYVQSMPGLITAFGGNQIEYFTIYAEPLGGGSYRFYFLY